MKITLAYPHDGHEPNETIEVSEEVGRQLIADGWARPEDKVSAPPKAPAGKPAD